MPMSEWINILAPVLCFIVCVFAFIRGCIFLLKEIKYGTLRN